MNSFFRRGRLGLVAGLLLGGAAASRAQAGFGAASSYPMLGTAPLGLAVADFNADGRLDVAVSNYYDTNLNVLPGTGTGAFGAATLYATGGQQANLLAAAYINADGRLDLLVTNQGSNSVGVLLGQSDPSGLFAPATNYPCGAGPAGLVVADVDRDRRPDLVTANSTGNSVSVLRNTYPLAAVPTLPAAEVSLYPIPARGVFTVQLPSSAAATAVQAELLDGLGRVVRRLALCATPEASLTVEVAGLPAGLYYLRLQAATWQLTRGVALE